MNTAPAARKSATSLLNLFPAAHHDDFDGATTAASLAAAAELGAEALPLAPLEPVDEAFLHEEPAHRLQRDDVPAAPQEPSIEPQHHLNAPPAFDFAQSHTTSAFGEPYSDASAPVAPLAGQTQQAHTEPLYESHQPTQTAPSDAASNHRTERR